VARVPGALLYLLTTGSLQSSCEMVIFLLALFTEVPSMGVLGSSP